MSSLFEALKNLEKRQTQPENPFSTTPEAQHNTKRQLTHLLKNLISRPYRVLIAVLFCAVFLGFIAVFVMDEYLKRMPVQPIALKKNNLSTQAVSPSVTSENISQKQPETPVTSVDSQKDSSALQEAKAPSDAQKPADAEQKKQLVEQLEPEPAKDTSLLRLKGNNDPFTTNKDTPQAPALQKEQQNTSCDMKKPQPAPEPGQVIPEQPEIRIQASPLPQDDISRWRKNLLEQAETLRKENKFHEAIPLYKQLWNATHDSAVANNLAAAYLAIKEPQSALEILKEAKEFAPQDEDIQYNMEIAQRMAEIQ